MTTKVMPNPGMQVCLKVKQLKIQGYSEYKKMTGYRIILQKVGQ